jgi:ribosomal protein S7
VIYCNLVIRVHISARKFELLNRYDMFLQVRKEKTNRYYVLFLFFYKDYLVYKVVNKLMRAGHKNKAFLLFRRALSTLKNILGFQPFFFFKHITFSMRQLFKVNTTTVRDSVTYLPAMLSAHNQVTYGIGHLIVCARALAVEDKLAISYGLCIVLLNCFICKATDSAILNGS